MGRKKNRRQNDTPAPEPEATKSEDEPKLSRKQKRLLKLQKKEAALNNADATSQQDKESEEEAVVETAEVEVEEEEQSEEEIEAAPSKKKSMFAMMESSSESETENVAEDLAALKLKEEEEKKAKKKAKKEKKERKKKLSNKERRKLQQENEKADREKMYKELSTKETDFAVSATANTMTQEAWESATDIDIPEFTISAYGKTLFQDASLRITAGRRYGLVGPNGMGKSTLLKQIARKELKIPPKIDCLYVEQEVIADDTPAVEMVLRADKHRTALLEEEKSIMDSLDSNEDTTEAELNTLQQRLEAISQELRASGSDSAEARALSMLHGLGFTPEMQRAATKTFSGGWRMRVSIARALFIQPTLLLLDEPTNHLDLNAVIWLDDYLQKWKTTLLVVSHDQDFLDSVCTDIIHLDQQQLFYYKGNYSVFKSLHVKHLAKMKKAWEKQEKDLRALRKAGKSNKRAVEMAAKKKTREAGGSKGRKNQGKGGEQKKEAGSLAERQLLSRPKEYEVKFSFPEPTDLAPPIIQVNNISFNYPNGPVLFKDLSFGIDMESRITIVGPNGVGKSTLLKLITKELQPVEGEVILNRHLRIARYHQHFLDVLPFDESPVDFLRRVHDVPYQECRNRLGKYGLSGPAHTIKMVNLSGGQKSRVVFTSLSFQDPHVLILDEPTNNLDIESIDALADAINEFSGGVILVSHDARLICSTEMRLWICENATVEEMAGGFDAYRDEILELLEKQAEEESKRQAERIASKEALRKEKIAQLDARRKAKQAKS